MVLLWHCYVAPFLPRNGSIPGFTFLTYLNPHIGVGAVKDSVSCTFKERGFDLIVDGLRSGPCRLRKSNLDKNIDPQMSKFIVKQNKVIVKLKKVLYYMMTMERL